MVSSVTLPDGTGSQKCKMAAERMYLLVPQLIAVQLQFLVQDSEILCRGNVVSWEDMSGGGNVRPSCGNSSCVRHSLLL